MPMPTDPTPTIESDDMVSPGSEGLDAEPRNLERSVAGVRELVTLLKKVVEQLEERVDDIEDSLDAQG